MHEVEDVNALIAEGWVLLNNYVRFASAPDAFMIYILGKLKD